MGTRPGDRLVMPSWGLMVPVLGGLLVLFVAGAVMSGLAGLRYRFKSGTVQGVTGDLGGGKSMFVAAKILKPAAKGIASRGGLRCVDRGRKVDRIITNFAFDPSVFGYKDVEVVVLSPVEGLTIWEQVIREAFLDDDGKLRLDAIVAIDEMSLFAPSDAQMFDPIAKALLVHIRKLNAEFVWIAQDHMQVHKRLRKFSKRIWVCTEAQAVWTGLSPWRYFRADGYRESDIDKPMLKPLDRRMIRGTRKVMACYDTDEIISDDVESLAALEVVTQTANSVSQPADAIVSSGVAAPTLSVVNSQ